MTNKQLARELRSIGSSLFDTTYDPNNKLLLDEAADRLENQGQWISVDERLPEKLQRVLINYNGKVCISWLNANSTWFDCWNNQVTHWMPLPEAPKMKGGAE